MLILSDLVGVYYRPFTTGRSVGPVESRRTAFNYTQGFKLIDSSKHNSYRVLDYGRLEEIVHDFVAKLVCVGVIGRVAFEISG